MAQQPAIRNLLRLATSRRIFTLTGTMGGKITLADFKGKNPVVVAFFPAAFTGG